MKAKSENRHKFCDDIDKTVLVSEMWRRMRWVKGYKNTQFQVSIDQKEVITYLTMCMYKHQNFIRQMHLLNLTAAWRLWSNVL